jgi:glutathione S-transferase
MTATLELLHDWDSVCSFKVRMALAEKRLAWTSHRVDLFRFENLHAGFLALNPAGVVPVLRHGALVLPESSVVNEYLDERFPAIRLAPADPGERALMRLWIKLQDEVLYHAQRPATFQLMIKKRLSGLGAEGIARLVAGHPQPERARHFVTWATGPVDDDVVRDARQRIDAVLARLDAGLADGREWLAGGMFSLAECAFAPFVERLCRLRFHALWAGRPLLAAWMERIAARPSFAAARAPAEHRMEGP